MTTFIISGVVISIVLLIFMSTGKEESKGCSGGCSSCKSTTCNDNLPAEER